MKRRFHDALLGIVGLAGVALFALSGASCEGPKMQCAVGHGPFTIVYGEVVSGDSACYENAYRRYGAACAQYELDDSFPDCPGLSKVEHVGFSTYLTRNAENTGADYNTRNIAAQSSTMGGLLQERDGAGTDADDKPYALGDYGTFPDEQDLCYTGTSSAPLSTAEMNVAAFDVLDDMGMVVDTLPAVHYRQEWKDVHFYVTTGVPGTQVVGNMRFEDVQAGCSVEYKFNGVYPAVFCGNPVSAVGQVVAGGQRRRSQDAGRATTTMTIPIRRPNDKDETVVVVGDDRNRAPTKTAIREQTRQQVASTARASTPTSRRTAIRNTCTASSKKAQHSSGNSSPTLPHSAPAPNSLRGGSFPF
ncbi:MAG: hypothetical protein IPM54_03185 [Polyangiaceae bacterium]|nr:hypothetical protein [Polyangiaceae bacterium]